MFSEEEIDKFSGKYPQSLIDDMKNKKGKASFFYSNDGIGRRIFVNVGKKDELKDNSVRKSVESVVEILNSSKLTKATFEVHPGLIQIEKQYLTPDFISRSIVSSLLNSSYKFDKYITDPEKKTTPLEEVNISFETNIENEVDLQNSINSSISILNSKKLTRDLANERADVANPEWYEKEIKKVVEKFSDKLNIKVIQFDELKELGLNMIAAVGQGASVLPRLVIVEYNGNPASNEKIALVGKGITFDTGGLNLKPSGFIEDMYIDNHGAATVLGTLNASLELGIKKNIIAVFCLAENAISDRSFFPGSIIKSYSGKTVEIGNTDAEGRLVLGDGLTYVQKHYKPTHVIDIATLTGACVVALGENAAGIFTNDETFQEEIKKCGTKVGEIVWPLPILESHEEEIKGKESDLKNIGKGRYGGACTAAAFLKAFIEKDVKWVHLDIAGPAKITNKSASGFGVELLTEWLKNTNIGN